MSGLTVGYLSIDDLLIELRQKGGSETEQKYANRIYPIISERHWLLVTLLLCNAIAMEALPIYINKLVDEFLAIIISVTLVLFVGEVIPQALCTGPNQLKIASFLAPLTSALMYITYPVSYPIAMLLDYTVGKHSKSRFLNTDLKLLIEMHTLEALNNLNNHHDDNEENKTEVSKLNRASGGLGLHSEQAKLMISAVDMKTKKISDIQISIDDVFMIEYEQPINDQTLKTILCKGFSRIPIYASSRSNIIGLLRIKQLIGIDISQSKSIKQLGIRLSQPLLVNPDTLALELLSEFKKGHSHMAIVTPDVEGVVQNLEGTSLQAVLIQIRDKTVNSKTLSGIVTLEDVLEKMIDSEILDEDDYTRNKIMNNNAFKRGKSLVYRKIYIY